MNTCNEILITGGTSGLGLELVRVFLNKGYLVAALGRDPSRLPAGNKNLEFVYTDLRNLGQTAAIVNQLAKTHSFDVIINNAGILSPPFLTMTEDNLEVTFQVNFLAHLVVNEIIIYSKPLDRKLRIFSVTSPVFRIADRTLDIQNHMDNYNPIGAYSGSKLYLLLMNRHLSDKYHYQEVSCFGLNPGVFRSGIKRTQRAIFRSLYDVAAPFMKDPARLAAAFSEIVENPDLKDGAIYDPDQNAMAVPEIKPGILSKFWDNNYHLISCLVTDIKNLNFDDLK